MGDLSNYGWTLSHPKLFTQILSASSGKGGNFSTKDLITIKNEVCYIWKSEKRTIIRARCSDIWGSGSTLEELNGSHYKEYSTSADVCFEPARIEARYSINDGELILLWSASNLAVVKLANHQGMAREAASLATLKQLKGTQSDLIPTTCVLPDERVYMECRGLRILQAKWYPSVDHDIIAVLNNDNYLRFYLLTRPQTYISMIRVGAQGSTPFLYNTHAVGLVEAPIDFDFGPDLPSSGYKMIFVLKCSGDVSYILLKYLPVNCQFYWQEKRKHLSVDGEDIDDCFQDASAILASKTFPVVLTIGCTSGNLNHTVLFPVEEEVESVPTTKLRISMEESILNGDVKLFLKEVVEIEPEDDELGLVFMKLLPDPVSSHRYAAVHGEGVHILSMNFVPKLEEFFKGSANSQTSQTSALAVLDAVGEESISTKSSIRYVLKCKLIPTAPTGSSKHQRQKANVHKSNFTFSDLIPQKFVLLLGDYGTAVYDIPHTLDPDAGRWTEAKTSVGEDTGDEATPGVEKLRGSGQLKVLETITSMLKKTLNQPLLLRRSPKERGGGEGKMDDREGAQLIEESLRALQRDYVGKQEQALSLLTESLKTIALDTKEVGDYLTAFMTKDLAEVRTTATRLAEEYGDLAAKEVELQRRLNAVIASYHDQVPVLTDEEKGWLQVLDQMESDVESMQELVGGLHLKVTSPLLARGRDTAPQVVGRTGISDPQLNSIRLAVARHQRALVNLRKNMNRVNRRLPNT